MNTRVSRIVRSPAFVSAYSSSGWGIWTLILVLIILLLIGWINLVLTPRHLSWWRRVLEILGMTIITSSIILLAYSPRLDVVSLMCRSNFAPIWAGIIGLACVAFSRGFVRLAALISGGFVTGLWYVIALSLR